MADPAQPIEIKIEGLEELIKRLGDPQVWAAAKKRMGNGLMIVEGQARQDAPVDMGLLRQSITHEIREVGSEMQGVTGSPLVYAPVMELGRRPGQPGPSAAMLAGWCHRHGLDGLEYVIARAIHRNGIEGKHMLQGAWDQKMDEVKAEMRKVLDDVAQNLGATP
jgi:hypothetical protein